MDWGTHTFKKKKKKICCVCVSRSLNDKNQQLRSQVILLISQKKEKFKEKYTYPRAPAVSRVSSKEIPAACYLLS